MVQVGVMTFASCATRARHKKEPPLLGVSCGGSVVRGDKILRSGSRGSSVSVLSRSCGWCWLLGLPGQGYLDRTESNYNDSVAVTSLHH